METEELVKKETFDYRLNTRIPKDTSDMIRELADRKSIPDSVVIRVALKIGLEQLLGKTE